MASRVLANRESVHPTYAAFGSIMAKSLLVEAQDLMLQALDLVDKDGSAHDVGAHLDLAIVRLAEVLAKGKPTSGNDNSVVVQTDQSATRPPKSRK